MGNCQAIDDNASVVIQQPCGRVDKMYWPVPASHIMNNNPGYYVALLLTTTTTFSSAADQPLRITRIKLLRPTDNLLLGHTYRLVNSQEVMKGLWAKKFAKMQNKLPEASTHSTSDSHHINASTKSSLLDNKTKLVIKHDRHRTKTSSTSSNSATARPRGWHPSLHSISEADHLFSVAADS